MINGTCYRAGTLTLHRESFQHASGNTIHAKGLADYEFKSPESLQETASSYQWIIRPSGQREPGRAYTLRKAKNDFAE